MWADRTGAQTPEELETLLEDALILRDSRALRTLFEPGASLMTDHDPPARNRDAIVRLALATWGGEHPYVADPRQIVVARDIALIIGEQGLHVAHRDRDGAWQYAIVLQRLEDGKERETIMSSEPISTQRLQPVAVAKDEGDARW